MVIGLDPLRDNSFLTHLATGRLILERGSVPTTDAYSFTAPGASWVVQSWLVSVLYAAAEQLGDLDAVRVVAGTLSGAVAWLGWRVLRPIDGIVARLAVAAVFVAVGAGTWAERPFMVGLVAFALTMLVAEGASDPRWLVPLGWVWVNSHGSFPLGLVYLAVMAVGARLDGGDHRRQIRCLKWAGIGALVGAVGPLGLRPLIFPLELLSRQELLANVVEWQAPAFTGLAERAFLLQLVVAIVLMARRPSYRVAIALAVFTAAALVGSRNVPVASLAILPGMAAGLAGVGGLATSTAPRRAGVVFLTVGLLATLLAIDRLDEPSIELRPYPVDVVAYLESQDVDLTENRMAGPVVTGNLLTFLYGADGRRVFYDDRFDMYPDDVSRAALALTNAERSVLSELERYDIELVTLRVEHPLTLTLNKDPDWRTLFIAERWQLSCRRGADLGGAAHTC